MNIPLQVVNNEVKRESIHDGYNPAKGMFELGWDYYAARQGAPDDAEDHQDFLNGYNTAKSKHIKQDRGDRYHLKWLQLRYGALKRRRIFDPNVTPEYLESIDGKICPVTRMVMTHSTGMESDWSVDRVNNQVGYTPGNLAIVSHKANNAKANLTFSQINDICYTDMDVGGLSHLEWCRWLSISSMNAMYQDNNDTKVGFHCVPMVCPPPPGLFLNTSAFMQMAVADRAVMGNVKNFEAMSKNFTKSDRQGLREVLKEASKVAYMAHKGPLDIWYSNRLFMTFYRVYDGLDLVSQKSVMSGYTRLPEVSVQNVEFKDAWDHESKGYHKKMKM